MSIQVPIDFQMSPYTERKFLDLIEFFNKLEKDLEWPNCEGYADKTRILAIAQRDLANKGLM